jgi:hypothetical protein
MRPPTADLNMTFALSVTAFVAIQIAGITAHGVVGRIKHMSDPPFLFPIELIGELSRILRSLPVFSVTSLRVKCCLASCTPLRQRSKSHWFQ